MTESVPTPRRRTMRYAILGGIAAATIPFYCAAAVLIVLRPTPTPAATPVSTAEAIPSRYFPMPSTDTPLPTKPGTDTITHTPYIPPTGTPTATRTETPVPTQPPTPTLTHTPPPTETPTPTATATETTAPTDTP